MGVDTGPEILQKTRHATNKNAATVHLAATAREVWCNDEAF